MASLRVNLLLCFVGVLSAAPKGSLERLCEEGKEWHNVSILKVCEGGNGSLDLRLQLNTTNQALVSKCDPLTYTQEELFVGCLGNLQRLTNETRISLTSGTFSVQNAKRTDEGIYVIALHNEDTILLAIVNLTLCGPTVQPSEILSSTAFPPTIPQSLSNSGISKPSLPSAELPSSTATPPDVSKAPGTGYMGLRIDYLIVVAAFSIFF